VAKKLSKTYKTTLVCNADASYVPVPFDPKEVFGKVRAPIVVKLNGYSYRSTIFAMSGEAFIPLRKSHREAAGVEDGQTLSVTLELDEAPRDVEPPEDLVKALEAVPAAWTRWQALSYTHRREHVEAIEGAKQPATRQRRIANAVKMCATR
jgi:hypothetical protein